MITPFSHPDFQKNQRCVKQGTPCVVCGKEIRTDIKMIRVVDGGSRFAGPAEVVALAGDMGFFPIGADCLRKNPELRHLVI